MHICFKHTGNIHQDATFCSLSKLLQISSDWNDTEYILDQYETKLDINNNNNNTKTRKSSNYLEVKKNILSIDERRNHKGSVFCFF